MASHHLSTKFLKLDYSPKTGRLSLFNAETDRPLLLHAAAAAVFPSGLAAAGDAESERSARTMISSEKLLPGQQLEMFGRDRARSMDLQWRVTLLEDRPGAVFELVVTNASSNDLLLRGVEPLRALLDEHAGCFFGGASSYTRVRKALTNGYLYYDAGELLDFGWRANRDFLSYWNAAFYCDDSQETLVVGFLENRTAIGEITAGFHRTGEWQDAQAGFNLTARSQFNRHFILRPGASISSGRALFLLSPDPFTGLESYADTYGRLHQVKLNPIVNGWSSWFYEHIETTEAEQLKNAEFIARHLKPFGLQTVQVDDGFQRAFGDWEGNHLYPHGMKWLAGRIHALGLKAGLWLAPFVISENTDIARNHQDWLARDAAGNLQTVGASGRAKYILDIAHPGACQWLRDLFTTVTHDWGYDFIKIDFVEWSLLAVEQYHDPGMSKAQVYRLANQTIREAIGPDRHLLDCGPGPVAVGLIDSMRIELDVAGHCSWEQYAKNSNSSAPAMAKRYYWNNRTWINDADHLGLALLTIPQAQAAASVIALSGGTMILADRLYDLDPARLEILKKVLPSHGEAARPLDLFEKLYPEMFALKLQKPFDSWWVLGCFNWDEGAWTVREFDFHRLGLETNKTYLVYEFWTQRFLGEVCHRIPFKLDPSSVQLVAIREKRDVPQLLGTDRHFTQGALELENVRWDEAGQTFSGTALGAPGMNWNLAVHVPERLTWDAVESMHFHDFPNFSAVSYHGLIPHEHRIVRVHLRFEGANRVEWHLKFRERSAT